MARVRQKNTQPEHAVRRLLRELGFRYRIHLPNLPGTPDIVFPAKRKVLFVHGCFWHRHEGCKAASTPKTRADFWSNKFNQNIARDERKIAQLQAGGWAVAVIWSCETKDLPTLALKLQTFLTLPRNVSVEKQEASKSSG